MKENYFMPDKRDIKKLEEVEKRIKKKKREKHSE
jgi:hypothetical protein